MEVGTLVLRTLFIYFFIMIVMRMMGKREIGKLSIFDLVVSIMIAELAVIAIEDTKIPMLYSIIPIGLLFFIQITLSYISLKSQKVRDFVDGKPSVLVEHGEIREEEMKKQRYNLDDLLMQLREKKIHSLNQVEFAILEPSGKLSVFEKKEGEKESFYPGNNPRTFELPVVLIKDGKVLEEGLKQIEKDHFWLKRELEKRIGKTSFKQISYCTVDVDGIWYIDFKDKK